MIYQKVNFGIESQKEMLKGAKILSDAVRSTMGPSGQNVIIDNEEKAPIITKDGVTVAKSINLKSKLPSVGAELLKEVASKTNELAGDGTTTATVLGYELLHEGIKMIASNRSPVELKRGMDFAKDFLTKFLTTSCIPIEKDEDIINIGTISANGDRDIGMLLYEAIKKVGRDGIITVEPSKSVKTTLELTEGMQLESGYVAPYFMTNGEKMTCEFSNCLILMTTQKISSMQEILPVLEISNKISKPLLIICEDMEAEALQTCIVNKQKGVLRVCVVKAPGFGENRVNILQDISTIVGGEVIGSGTDVSLKTLKLEHLGTAKTAIIGRNYTTIISSGEAERKQLIDKKVNELRYILENDKTLDELRVNQFKHRLAKLSGGIAVIKVGGSTEVEILEKKDRVDDALNATIAAIQEGIVPGGGTALCYGSYLLKSKLFKNEFKEMTHDEKAGVEIVINACLEPLKTIVRNTGASPEVVLDKLQSNIDEYVKQFEPKVFSERDNSKTFSWDLSVLTYPSLKNVIGYNSYKHEYHNLVLTGIIDPVKVTRLALEHSISVIGLMITCNCIITNEEI